MQPQLNTTILFWLSQTADATAGKHRGMDIPLRVYRKDVRQIGSNLYAAPQYHGNRRTVVRYAALIGVRHRYRRFNAIRGKSRKFDKHCATPLASVGWLQWIKKSSLCHCVRQSRSRYTLLSQKLPEWSSSPIAEVTEIRFAFSFLRLLRNHTVFFGASFTTAKRDRPVMLSNLRQFYTHRITEWQMAVRLASWHASLIWSSQKLHQILQKLLKQNELQQTAIFKHAVM